MGHLSSEVMGCVSLSPEECVLAGVPHLQGLASYPSVMFVRLRSLFLSNHVNVRLKIVFCHRRFSLHVRRSFFPPLPTDLSAPFTPS